MKNIAVFASGTGSNFQAIIQAVKMQQLKANIALLVSDKPQCGAVEIAKSNGIEVFTFSAKAFENKEAYEQAILLELRQHQVDYLILAGYMKVIGNVLLSSYPMKIINLHPALLPAFPGAHGIADAFNYGVKVFGITIHYVDAGVDTGAIIDQYAFHIEEGESVEDVERRIHALEHQYYPATIHRVLNEE